MDPKLEHFFSAAGKWQKEMERLRKIALSCGLEEDLKWGKPCYTHGGKNIVVIQSFKDYCALLFLKGLLLTDPDNILVKTGENTRVGRQARFTDLAQITKNTPALKTCIYEAMKVEEEGLKIKPDKKPPADIPAELEAQFKRDKNLKAAFAALTPGRQRAWIYHFAQAKQSATREARVQKAAPKILAGKGFNDY